MDLGSRLNRDNAFGYKFSPQLIDWNSWYTRNTIVSIALPIEVHLQIHWSFYLISSITFLF